MCPNAEAEFWLPRTLVGGTEGPGALGSLLGPDGTGLGPTGRQAWPAAHTLTLRGLGPGEAGTLNSRGTLGRSGGVPREELAVLWPVEEPLSEEPCLRPLAL